MIPLSPATGAMCRRARARRAAAPAGAPMSVTKPTLFDVPVSNNGARVRAIARPTDHSTRACRVRGRAAVRRGR